MWLMRIRTVSYTHLDVYKRQTIYFAALFLPIMIIGIFLLINTYTLLSNYHRDLLEADNLRVKTILFEMTTQVYNCLLYTSSDPV